MVCYFPASGAYASGSGFVVAVGSTSYCWCSSSEGFSALLGSCLYVSLAKLNLLVSSARASAFSVRCVQVFVL